MTNQSHIDFKTKLETVCFDTSYNRNCESENITRAQGWGEVYGLIAEMTG